MYAYFIYKQTPNKKKVRKLFMNKTNEIQSKTVDAELSAPVEGKTPKGRLITPFNLGYTKTKEFYGKVVAKSERNAVIAGLQKVAYAVATIFAAIAETLANAFKFVLNTVAVTPINFVHGLVAKPKKGTEPVATPKVEQKKEETPKVKEPVLTEKMTAKLRALAQDSRQRVEDKKSVDSEVLGWTQAAQKEGPSEKKLDLARSVEEGEVIILDYPQAMQEGKASEVAKPEVEVAERKAEVAAESVVNEVIVEQPVVEPAVKQDNLWFGALSTQEFALAACAATVMGLSAATFAALSYGVA